MKYYDEVVELLYKVIDDINLQYRDDFELIKTEDTALFGKDGSLDSLALVNFVIATEQLIEEKFDTSITLANERAMAQKNSPFNTIKSLATYTSSLLEIDKK